VDLVSYLISVKRTLRTLALLPLLDLPFEPSPNAHKRIEVSRLDIREVEPRDPLWWPHSCVRVLTDGGGVEFRLSGEMRVERTQA
jgi:hypothetical protein